MQEEEKGLDFLMGGRGRGGGGGGRGDSVLFCGVHLRGVGVPYTEVSPITCLVLCEYLQFLF